MTFLANRNVSKIFVIELARYSDMWRNSARHGRFHSERIRPPRENPTLRARSRAGIRYVIRSVAARAMHATARIHTWLWLRNPDSCSRTN